MGDGPFRNQVISCGSLSKTLGSRLRIGWVRGGHHHEAIVQRKFVATTAAQRKMADLGPGLPPGWL